MKDIEIQTDFQCPRARLKLFAQIYIITRVYVHEPRERLSHWFPRCTARAFPSGRFWRVRYEGFGRFQWAIVRQSNRLVAVAIRHDTHLSPLIIIKRNTCLFWCVHRHKGFLKDCPNGLLTEQVSYRLRFCTHRVWF